ncbi:MAG: hypothetical protein M1816_004955 [Peltula sp. TS41687]|nr:MAG: hypothetical protein M1816_004955 [Peltula sp. TS41687]
MEEVKLNDDVRSVRSKLGMKGAKYNHIWRRLQKAAEEICDTTYGDTLRKDADLLPGVKALKAHYTKPALHEDDEIQERIANCLRDMEGSAAWLINNALKRNHDRRMKSRA